MSCKLEQSFKDFAAALEFSGFRLFCFNYILVAG